MIRVSHDQSLTGVSSQNTSLTDGAPSSPSSMMNQYREEEEEELFITVDHPESHVTAIETFITYRVMTKVRGAVRRGSVDLHHLQCM